MLARLALALAAALCATRPAAAENSIDQDLAERLKPSLEKIIDLLKKESQPPNAPLKKVKLGKFNPPPHPQSNVAPKIKDIVTRDLAAIAARLGHPIVFLGDDGGDPDLTITAEMAYKTNIQIDNKLEDIAVLVNFNLQKIDGGGFGIPLQELVRELRERGAAITKPEVVASVLGVGVEFLPNATDKAKQHAVGAALKNPAGSFQVDEKGTKLSIPGNPFAVELLVADLAKRPLSLGEWDTKNPNVTAAKIDLKAGRPPAVSLRPGQVYAVKVHIVEKGWEHDAAIDLKVDGLSAFHFVDADLREPKAADGKPVFKYYVCPRHSQPGGGAAVIGGWHKSNTESLSFLLGEYGKGSAGAKGVQQPDPKDVGVITVHIAGAWNEGENPPERVKGKDGVRKLQTELGPPIQTKYQPVDKKIGAFNTTLSIHYVHAAK